MKEINKAIPKNAALKDILKLAPSCDCEDCRHGCKVGSGFLVEDVKKIAMFLKITEDELKEQYLEEVSLFNKKMLRPKHGRPYGKCVFFDDGCRIHAVKPLQCRISMGCKNGEELNIWFMLNYLIDPYDPESIRQFALYLESGGKTLEGGRLEEIVPDKKLLKKILSYEILK